MNTLNTSAKQSLELPWQLLDLTLTLCKATSQQKLLFESLNSQGRVLSLSSFLNSK